MEKCKKTGSPAMNEVFDFVFEISSGKEAEELKT
jgi:hypothetical protein